MHAPLYAIASGGGMVALGLLVVGMALPPRPQPPVLVNAVAVNSSDDRLPDDWVHLFRRRRRSRAFAFGLAAISL